jgi:predicted nucleotidyltransferase|tara:strand:- start:411 stop:1010 length:600 start_codon:yes stop_codon:yes gene_type:complete
VIVLEFKEFLKNNKNARKIFGKKEIAIILKQLEGVSLTQSEKNRLSRDIRPKLQLIKEISEFEDEFEIKKGSDNKKVFDKAKKLILNDKLKHKIKAILLFGSHSKGIVTKRSDIDICVIFTDISLEEATKFRIRISGEFPKKVDIQVFNILPQKIKRSIAGNHKILYRNEDFDNLSFTVRYLKDDDYFIRMNKIMGASA